MKTVSKAAGLAALIVALGLFVPAQPAHASKNNGFFGSFGEWLATPPGGVKKKRNYRHKKVSTRTNYSTTTRSRDYRSYRDANGNIDWNAYARSRVTPEQAVNTGTTAELVNYNGSQEAGSIVISTSERRLYLILPGNKARAYKIGVGRPGFEWYGVHRISRKTEWPDWRPPAEMRKRQPYLPEFMPGGPGNPLGARAMYLGATLYRIHGTTENHTIGMAVSSGCIRMLNEDVIDLYQRVTIGTKVYVGA